MTTADEARLCHMLWNYSPCIAQSADPRWGRTYESYGSDLETIIKLGTGRSFLERGCGLTYGSGFQPKTES